MRALVTGGGGFLGRRIVELLLEQRHDVRFLARSRYPDVEALGAEGLQVDLTDRNAVRRAVEGVDTVFHVAAKAGFYGRLADYWPTNVEGTRNLVDAMEDAGVGRLVYTSTPSVVGYEEDHEEGSQDLPYSKHFASPYPESKAAAERLVLEANSPGLATVSLRPHLIYGPRDTNLIPRVIDRAEKGRLRIIGDGDAVVDVTYVDNAAWAHLDAAAALTDHTAPCAGKPYFISDDHPVKLWEWVNDLLGRVGVRPVTRKVPYRLARTVAGGLQLAWSTLHLSGEPPLTPFLVDGLARHHWYDMAPARRDLAYRVRVAPEVALERTVAWIARSRSPTDP